MIFEQIATGGCQSYLIGCSETCAAVVIDPELSQIDRYSRSRRATALRIRYLIDTHTHADHFSATRELARQLGVPVVMHRASPAPFVDMRLDDGEMIVLGKLRLQVMHTPGHTRRLDVPAGGGSRLHRRHAADRRHRPHRPAERRSGGALRQPVQPRAAAGPGAQGHTRRTTTRARSHSTIGEEIADQPAPAEARPRRVRRDDAAASTSRMPTHVTEALRTNMSGGKTVAQLLAEAAAAVPFMSLAELKARVEAGDDDLIVLDVRERDAYEGGHIPGARLLPRGQLELRVNQDLPDPTRRILDLLRVRPHLDAGGGDACAKMGFQRAVALDGGMKAWREAGYPLTFGSEP